MLIEIEGPRGAGKSTLIEALCSGNDTQGGHFVSASAAEEDNADGGWFLGVFMRSLGEPLPARESLFLYCARTAGRARVISRLLAPGTVVLSDRLSLSLYAQARLAGLDHADAQTLVHLALQGLTPDCTILLDTDYPAHRKRLTTEGREPQGEQAFQARRDLHIAAFQAASAPRIHLDTTAMTAAEVRDAVLRRLPVSRPA